MEKIEFINPKEEYVFDAIMGHKKTLNFAILKTALRKKDIRINDKKIEQNIIAKIGDKITIFLNEKKEKNIKKIFEDKNILIVFKPQGLEVTRKDKTFLDSKSLEELVDAVAVHRLDKNTEGLVVFAKNEMAENCLLKCFKTHQIEKEYDALVFGNVKKNGENFVDFLKKEQNFVEICSKNDKNAQIAKLSYVYVSGKNGICHIKLNLETGRTHQIRVQLSSHKIYVLGDEKYGQKQVNKQYKKTKQQLCASKLTFKKLSFPLEYLTGKVFSVLPTFDLNNFEKI